MIQDFSAPAHMCRWFVFVEKESVCWFKWDIQMKKSNFPALPLLAASPIVPRVVRITVISLILWLNLFELINYCAKVNGTVTINISCLAHFTTPIFVSCQGRCIREQGPFRTSLDPGLSGHFSDPRLVFRQHTFIFLLTAAVPMCFDLIVDCVCMSIDLVQLWGYLICSCRDIVFWHLKCFFVNWKWVSHYVTYLSTEMCPLPPFTLVC